MATDRSSARSQNYCASAGFVLGLLPYLYLPIRAAQDPLFNWGDPDSLSRLYHHVSGRQYQVWFMADESVFRQQTDFFLSKLPSELGYIGLAVAALGLVLLAKQAQRILLMTALMFIACFFWAGRYDILEIEPYYMLCILAVGAWCAAGAQWLEGRIGKSAAVGAMSLLVVIVAAINFGRANERTNVMVEDMTVNVLSTLPPNSVVFSSQWDFWVSGSWYMQAVEGMRRDVVVVDQELLRRSWYLDQMATWHPELMALVRPLVERFRGEVLKFEEGEPYDAGDDSVRVHRNDRSADRFELRASSCVRFGRSAGGNGTHVQSCSKLPDAATHEGFFVCRSGLPDVPI